MARPPEESKRPSPAGEARDHPRPGFTVEIAVHDTSRFEWRVTLPLPPQGHLRYSIDAEFELPSTPGPGRSPWDQLQGITRLEEARPRAAGEPVTVDGIRRGVLILVQRLRFAREGFWRHCRAVADDSAGKREIEAEPFLASWLDAALASLSVARLELSRSSPDDRTEVKKELALADEFISVRTFDMLADAQAAIEATLGGHFAEDERLAAAARAVDSRFLAALDKELAYRRNRDYPVADPDSPESLEQYVERAGRLKKHFEAILALERHTRQVNDLLAAWVTGLLALLTGAAAFAIQFVIQRPSPGSRYGSGAVTLVIVAAAIYAARERLKEAGHAWLTGRVYRFYAQRVVRCYLQSESSRARRVRIASAREWCNETTGTRPDPLNPESGASMRTTLVNHVHKGVIRRRPELTELGVRRVRQVFRYDLTPLFSQLHDPLKRIPIIDPATGRSRFVTAPRRYQIPIRVILTAAGQPYSACATLVIDKSGITRLDRMKCD